MEITTLQIVLVFVVACIAGMESYLMNFSSTVLWWPVR